MEPNSEYLTAAEAADLLGVQLRTVYQYATRGLIGSISRGGGRSRRSGHHYRRADVEALKQRAAARAGHGAVAASALRWGEPVLESGITLIAERGPYYRGVSASELARLGLRFEQVAEFLWRGEHTDRPHGWRIDVPTVAPEQLAPLLASESTVFERLLLYTAAMAPSDPERTGAGPDADLRRARSLVRQLAAAVALPDVRRMRRALKQPTVAKVLASALKAPLDERTQRLFDLALILSADHELNASTFAARVTASTGADLYACTCAALCALSGPLHGGATGRIEALVDEVERPERAAEVLRARLGRGEPIPGFERRPYPEGDPRARPLLNAARDEGRSTRTKTVIEICDAMARAAREPAQLDVGLVALAEALELPRGSAAAMFAVGRSAGWIAHVLEQRTLGVVLRPRARYTGPLPRPAPESLWAAADGGDESAKFPRS